MYVCMSIHMRHASTYVCTHMCRFAVIHMKKMCIWLFGHKRLPEKQHSRKFVIRGPRWTVLVLLSEMRKHWVTCVEFSCTRYDTCVQLIYIYIYICIYVYILYIYMCVQYLYIYYAYICVCVQFVYIYIYILWETCMELLLQDTKHKCICVCEWVCVYVFACVCVCVYVYVCI